MFLSHVATQLDMCWLLQIRGVLDVFGIGGWEVWWSHQLPLHGCGVWGWGGRPARQMECQLSSSCWSQKLNQTKTDHVCVSQPTHTLSFSFSLLKAQRDKNKLSDANETQMSIITCYLPVQLTSYLTLDHTPAAILTDITANYSWFIPQTKYTEIKFYCNNKQDDLSMRTIYFLLLNN